MGSILFSEILCGILKRSRFRLVYEFKWSSRRSLCSKICKSNFKNQIPEVRFPLTSWCQVESLYMSERNKASTMPKCTSGSCSDSVPKEESQRVEDIAHIHSIKHKKKKKKKKSSHKRKESKKHSSKTKAKLIMSDLSADADLCIIYDSRTTKQKKVINPFYFLSKKAKREEEETKKNPLSVDKKSVGVQGTCSEETKDIKKESVTNSFSQRVCGQASSVGPTCATSSFTQKEQNIPVDSVASTSEGILFIKSDQEVSGPSGHYSSEKYKGRKNKTRKREIKSRVWQFSDFGRKMTKQSEDCGEEKNILFTVLSYNVLCQEILEEHMELYQFNDPAALSWDYRSELLLKQFMDFNADIMCLQEVQESHLKTFYSKLEQLGYTGLFKQRTGGKQDGVAIYYKNSVFKLIDYTTVEYYQPGVWVLNRDNVGLIVKLAPIRKPNERLVVATTHLLYNPNRHDVKLAQLQLLLAEVERFAFKGMDESTKATHYWPVILTGDLNLEPDTGGFQLLNMGWFRYFGLSSKTLTADRYGYGQILGNELIPSYLGVTDTCQHWNLVVQRKKKHSLDTNEGFISVSSDNHKSEIKLLQIYNSDFEKQRKSVSASNEPAEMMEECLAPKDSKERFSSGELSHKLQLNSVYTHDTKSIENGTQVSTYQDRWVVVDYMFYSSCDTPLNISEERKGTLRLVARYNMFSEREASSIGQIPNLVSPSDHYPLAAKFLLE